MEDQDCSLDCSAHFVNIAANVLHFCIDETDFLTVSKDGLKFNFENFPAFKADDFAREFIKIVEKEWKAISRIQGHIVSKVPF